MRWLKRKAADDTIEVENLLALAVLGDAAAVPLLRELKAKHNWSDTGFEGRRRVIPFGRWADTVCCYLESGCDGLVALAKGARTRKEFSEFCLGLLEELRTPESVRAVLTIAGPLVRRPARDVATSVKLAATLSNLVSLSGGDRLDATTEETVRGFVHTLLRAKLTETQRCLCVIALWAAGDESSIRLIEALPPFRHPWKDVGKRAVKGIRKRLRERGVGQV
jgi:hypothetical protein